MSDSADKAPPGRGHVATGGVVLRAGACPPTTAARGRLENPTHGRRSFIVTLPADRLCLFASPRADDAKGPTARLLRGAGLTLLPWPPPFEPQAAPPRSFDALVVFGAGGEWPGPSAQSLVALLRQAWRQGATIGLFGGAADLLGTADIAPDGAPVEAAGLFIDERQPSAGTVEEMTDAMQSGPHVDR
ncbi:MAG TPA: hypothetical protein VFQ20_05790 [Burkholderiaceae bacterium]|nr:hypothetical protein [Burkholderiaceae bacterium]